MVATMPDHNDSLDEKVMETMILLIAAWLPIPWVFLTMMVCLLLFRVPAGQYGPWRRVWLWLTLGSFAIAPLWLRNALIITGVTAEDSWILQMLLSFPVRITLTNLSAFSFLMSPIEAYRIFRYQRAPASDPQPVAQVIVDWKGIIIGWNAAAFDLLGWSEQEAEGQELASFMIPEELMVEYHGTTMPAREAHRQGLQHFYHTGEAPVLSSKYDTVALHKDGRRLEVTIIVNAHMSSLGQTFQAQVIPRPPLSVSRSLHGS
jgi:PAS domain S-box-containing protein